MTMSEASDQPLLEVENLTIQYETPDGPLTAVANASFTIHEKEYFGIVGESGCGKSTIAKAIIGGLDENGHITSGKIRFRGQEIQDLTEKEFNNQIRWKEVSFIPQSAMNSLDPLQKIEDQARQIASAHGVDVDEALMRFRELFEVMGLDKNRIADYPHQFSGGMKQRVVIALSLFLNPSLIIADEPTTALDVIMQDQIMEHLESLKDEQDVSMALITHDISVVFESFERMAVMHGGQVCEVGTTREIYYEPHHPYTNLLQRSFPDIRYPNRELEVIEGVPPDEYGEVTRCTFADRCPIAGKECREGAPNLKAVKSNNNQSGRGQRVACVKTDEALEHFESEENNVDSQGVSQS